MVTATLLAPVMLLLVAVLALTAAVNAIARCPSPTGMADVAGVPEQARAPASGPHVVTSELGVPTDPLTEQPTATIVEPAHSPAPVPLQPFPSAAAGAGSPALPPPVPGIPTQVAGYHGEQLANAATIIGVAHQMGLDTWTATVAVMTAMGESSLRNLDHGDTAGPDSRGLFQQRGNGAWGTLADRMNPETATRNFLTALLAVPGYHDQPPTIAAHRTQRNADPQHYARHWPAATQVVAALSRDPTLVSRLADHTPPPACEAPPTADPGGADGSPQPETGGGQQIVDIAASLTGIPYRWGGSTPAAFDCSGYTQYVYARAGITLPRTAAQQQAATTPVTTPAPGDLVFFGRPATHVGIYAGVSADGRPQMYDAPRTGTVTGLHDVWSNAATYGRTTTDGPD